MALTASTRARLRVLLMIVVVLGGLTVFLWTRVKRVPMTSTVNDLAPNANTSLSPTPNASPSPSFLPTPSPTPSTAAPESEPGLSNETSLPAPQTAAPSFVGELSLIVPVAGVRPDQLLDTFSDARSEGRSHDAIDIPAAAGTPVLAAADGEIARLFQSERGGMTIYQLNSDRKLIFYYAHLQRYADGLVVGKAVRRGELIAYVGDTGNAGTGNFHLHFSIMVIADPKRYWEGTNINPYPLMKK